MTIKNKSIFLTLCIIVLLNSSIFAGTGGSGASSEGMYTQGSGSTFTGTFYRPQLVTSGIYQYTVYDGNGSVVVGPTKISSVRNYDPQVGNSFGVVEMNALPGNIYLWLQERNLN